MSDKTFDKAEFEQAQKECREEGYRLLRPRGLRKYYCLDEIGEHARYRLGATWLDAKGKIKT